jgi:hypothetical protein
MQSNSISTYFKWNESPNFGLLIGTICFSIHLGLTVGLLEWNYFSNKTNIDFSHIDQLAEGAHWHRTFDLNRFDSVNYRRIVISGYHDVENPLIPHEVIRWYPGYPAIAKGVAWLTGWSIYGVFSGLSALFTLCFWLLLWTPKMILIFGRSGLFAVSSLIICWPGAFFWFSGMIEPLVGLLSLVILQLWLTKRLNWLVIVIGYATSVKQVFVPLALGVIILDLVRNHTAIWKVFLRALIALSGFMAFGFYSWLSFGNFFASNDYMVKLAGYQLSILNLFNLKLYVSNIGTKEGFIAIASLIFLFIEYLRISKECNGWRHLFLIWRRPATPSVDFILWWSAFVCTAFFIIGSADTAFGNFIGMLRYQTTNIFLFLLFACHFRKIKRWCVTILTLTPLLVTLVYLQRKYVVQYWLGQWVS